MEKTRTHVGMAALALEQWLELALATGPALPSEARIEVDAAMDKTRTHVGTTELSLEQWIKIALGYCPKPRM